MVSELPWAVPSASVNGRKSEKEKAKRYGAMLHPNSGSLGIKNDFSTEDTVYEDKNVAKSHTIKGSDLNDLFVNATRQGKEARYIVYFSDADVTIEGVVRRGK